MGWSMKQSESSCELLVTPHATRSMCGPAWMHVGAGSTWTICGEYMGRAPLCRFLEGLYETPGTAAYRTNCYTGTS